MLRIQYDDLGSIESLKILTGPLTETNSVCRSDELRSFSVIYQPGEDQTKIFRLIGH